MARFALTRSASLVGILLGLSVVVFLLEAIVPADPVRAMVGASATPQIVEAKRHELGLDRPLPAQYAQSLSGRCGATSRCRCIPAGRSEPISPRSCRQRWSLRRRWRWPSSSASPSAC